MYILLSPPSEKYMFIELINISSNTLNDAFAHLRDKNDDLPNQRRKKVARDIIQKLKSGTE